MSSTSHNERSDSVSSTDSQTDRPTAPQFRRSSSSGLYASLNAQKRSDDPASVARRQSMNDQRPKAGFFGSMWNNYVRGPSKSP